MKQRILLALDVGSRDEAMRLVESIDDLTGMFKVGLQLFMAEGPSLVQEIVGRGSRVFLDLKFHDIPNTVRRAAVEAGKLGVSMMTIHASGGRAMMEDVSRELEDRFGERKPLALAVTVLTSLDALLLQEIGMPSAPDVQVVRLARLAAGCGMDGVVCSPREARLVRDAAGPDFRIVTPGVRMPGQSADDQQRAATPREAIAAGADYIVVGRSVTAAADPRQALEQLLQSL